MPRWIAYEHETAAQLADALPPGAAIERHDGSGAAAASLVLHRALECEQPALALLPGDAAGEVLLLRTARPAPPEPPPPPRDPNLPIAYEAAGFLGLRDEPVYEDEDTRPRSWWRRIFGS